MKKGIFQFAAAFFFVVALCTTAATAKAVKGTAFQDALAGNKGFFNITGFFLPPGQFEKTLHNQIGTQDSQWDPQMAAGINHIANQFLLLKKRNTERSGTVGGEAGRQG